MGGIVAKFGGSSLADGQSVAAVLDVIHQNPSMISVVVSAPGKRTGVENDVKVTDLLLRLHNVLEDKNTQDVTCLVEEISDRYI